MKILFLDVETAPNLATVWGIWNQNIATNQLIESSYVMCYAAKMHGNKKIVFERNHREEDDSPFLLTLWTLLDDADVVVHYNGKKFDIPTINKEFLLYGLPPPSPYKQVDLLTVVRKQFRFVSNKLDYVCSQLGLGRKHKHEGHELWLKCMEGDTAAWGRMEKYNKQDIVLLEKLYHRLLPWISSHPNHALYKTEHDSHVCTNCGSDRVQKRGTAVAKTATYQRYHCQKCGTWMRGTQVLQTKEEKELRLVQEL